MLECAGLGVEDFAGGTIAHSQACFWGTAVGALAGVVDPAAASLAAHPRVEVGEMVPGAGDADGNCVCCIEAEEPDAGFVAMRDVGAHVEFGECGERRQCGRGA